MISAKQKLSKNVCVAGVWVWLGENSFIGRSLKINYKVVKKRKVGDLS